MNESVSEHEQIISGDIFRRYASLEWINSSNFSYSRSSGLCSSL